MQEQYPSAVTLYSSLFIISLFFFENSVSDAADVFAKKLSEWNTIIADWGGTRTEIADKGLTFQAVYTGETFSNVSGGFHRRTVYLDNVDLILILDAERLFGWKDTSFFVYGLGNQGDNPSENTGDAQTVSNIATFDTWKLYEAWVQKNLLHNQLSILMGLYDLNTEFDWLKSASLFINSSHGIDPTFSQSGENGPSIFPNTTIGARAKWKPVPWFYLQTVVLNGLAGDPGNPKGTHVLFDRNNGILSVTETAYLIRPEPYALKHKRIRRLGRLITPEYEGKIAFGTWFYTAEFDALARIDTAGNPVQIHGNHGVYVFAEQTIYYEKEDPLQNLTLFVRLGLADTRINRFGFYTGGGAVYKGLIPGRNTDEIGFAVAGTHNGSEYERAQARAEIPVDDSEWNLEITYRAQITNSFAVQPDIQYIINPDTTPLVKDALAIGIRFEIIF